MAKEKLSQKIPGLKISKDKKSEAVIEGELSAEIMQPYVREVVKEAGKDFEMPGFRKGQVPEHILKQSLNLMHVWSDAAHDALNDIYPEIIESSGLDAISLPQVEITKLAPDNPLGFRIRVGLMPEFKLPDYKKIGSDMAAKQKPAEVTDAEVEETIAYVNKSRTQEGKEPESLNDESVKSLGNFKDLAEFRARIKENIKSEKEDIARRQTREEIARTLSEKTKMELPEIVISEELQIVRRERAEEMERLKINEEEYLKQIKKSAAELETQEKEYVERQLKTRLILARIAEEEKISPNEKEVEQNAEYLMRRYPESNSEQVYQYVINMLTNEMVLEMLEGKKKDQTQDKNHTD